MRQSRMQLGAAARRTPAVDPEKIDIRISAIG
jgi:hypothetical protein